MAWDDLLDVVLGVSEVPNAPKGTFKRFMLLMAIAVSCFLIIFFAYVWMNKP